MHRDVIRVIDKNILACESPESLFPVCKSSSVQLNSRSNCRLVAADKIWKNGEAKMASPFFLGFAGLPKLCECAIQKSSVSAVIRAEAVDEIAIRYFVERRFELIEADVANQWLQFFVEIRRILDELRELQQRDGYRFLRYR
jgi:hypothetical protein